MRAALAAALTSTVLVLSACGGSSGPASNGIASKSPGAIVDAAKSAVANVSSVHVAGSVAGSSGPEALDLKLVNGKGGTGSVSVSGLNVQVVSLGNALYLSAGATFWRHFGGSAAAQLLSGKWLKTTSTGQFASFAQLTNLRTLFSKLLTHQGTLSRGATTTVKGQKVIAITDSAKQGTLYVATTGKPYPVEIVKTGSGGGKIDFDQFNVPVSLAAPKNAIDLSSLK